MCFRLPLFNHDFRKKKPIIMDNRSLGNPRNGSVEGKEMDWMYSLGRRNTELQERWCLRNWMRKNVNNDVWRLIKVTWCLLIKIEKARWPLPRPITYTFDDVTYTIKNYKVE